MSGAQRKHTGNGSDSGRNKQGWLTKESVLWATAKRSDGGKEGQLEGLSLSLASRPNVFGLLTPVFPELELGQTLLHAVYPNPSFQIPQLCPSPNLMLGSTGHRLMCWTIAAALSMFG